MSTARATIESADGLSLEAEIDEPAAARGVLVMCHPHPQLGGTMNAPLLLALRDHLVQEGWIVARFNFRGIGSSEGEPSTGEAEVADARGALSWARERYPDLPLVLFGWSFGAAVAVRALGAGAEAAGAVAIAPSVKPRPGISAGLPDAAEVELTTPLLFVCACNDDLVAIDDCRSWAQAAGARLIEMRGANHFFWGKYDDLAHVVAGWLDEVA